MIDLQRLAILGSLLASAMMANPAAAAEGRLCIQESLSPSGIADAVAIALEARPVTDEFRTATALCAQQHGWSDAATNDAMFFTVGVLASNDLAARAPFSAAQFSLLQRIVDDISDSDMRLVATSADGVDRVYSAIGQRAIADGLILSRAHSTFIGQYAAARATARIYAIAFDAR